MERCIEGRAEHYRYDGLLDRRSLVAPLLEVVQERTGEGRFANRDVRIA